MKKQYTKPGIIIEDFKIAQSISFGACTALNPSKPGGGSTGQPNYGDKDSCGWNMGNQVVWTDSDNGCSIEWGVDDPWGEICYNNPGGGNTIFSS